MAKEVDSLVPFSWLLTISRIPLLYAISYFVFTGKADSAFYCLLWFIGLDVIDGRIMLLTKRVNFHHRMVRHHFDAVIDRVATQTLLLVFLLADLMPLWVFILLTSQELAYIVIGLTVFFRQAYKRKQIIFTSRLASLFLGAIAVSFLFQAYSWEMISIAAYSYCRGASTYWYWKQLANSN